MEIIITPQAKEWIAVNGGSITVEFKKKGGWCPGIKIQGVSEKPSQESVVNFKKYDINGIEVYIHNALIAEGEVTIDFNKFLLLKWFEITGLKLSDENVCAIG